jgi:CRISPR-associated protein Csb3
MTELVLQGCDPRILLSHMALYGLAAICEASELPGVHVRWTPSGNPRPVVSADGADTLALATAVRQHAAELKMSWPERNVPGRTQALMSPRLSVFNNHDEWSGLQTARHAVLDTLTDERRWLDLRFLAALGEPCYWSTDQKGSVLQDNGASRFEMQPRNRGSEFVGTRLRKVAEAVAARQPSAVLAGLTGESVSDEAGADKPDSRTAAGLAAPGPSDNALTWCALWGISQFPLAMQVNSTAITSGQMNRRREEWFYVPVWHDPWRPARVRSVLASRSLRLAASFGLGLYRDDDLPAARAWLGARHVAGAIRFPVRRFGSDNAPERRAMSGELVPLT